MNWRAIAGKEFRDVRRSNVLWMLTGVITAITALSILTQSQTTTEFTPIIRALSSLGTLITLLFPLAVLISSYNAIIGELESGSGIYLLGLPNTRLDVLFGKFIGRLIVTTLSVTAAFSLGAVLLVVHLNRLPLGTYLGFFAVTLYFSAVWTGIGTGISALARSRGQALAAALSTYLVFVLGWVLPLVFDPRRLTAYLVESVLGFGAMPELYDLAYRFSPSTAYGALSGHIIHGTSDATVFFLEWWFMLVLLFCWLSGVLTVGYIRFRTMELAR
ncbi:MULTISPECIES: ABC transporter permease [Halorussus]|uniref:ABC transporter permease n=1 Tax=Halorussus TaxID=1070314 RepID=UPI000E215CBC|nr:MULTISPECIES: ABC transporter permease subunit [Halorussus]NHN59389.1 ABC transporter permease [Halorussus sp. JP-T4]